MLLYALFGFGLPSVFWLVAKGVQGGCVGISKHVIVVGGCSESLLGFLAKFRSDSESRCHDANANEWWSGESVTLHPSCRPQEIAFGKIS